MWLLAEYEATALFTLKPATATSSGGKTLLVPTPFAIKMALLDVICRTEGQAAGEAAWPHLRDLQIALRPAPRIVVNNTFTKILKPRRNPASPGSAHAGAFQKTIGYREYAYLDGSFGIGIQVDEPDDISPLMQWLAGIQYLGKRGSFVQLRSMPLAVETLPEDFLPTDGTLPETIELEQVMQQVDDAGTSLTFERANIYTRATIRLGADRLLRPMLLPYRIARSSRSYTYYEWSRA